QVDRVSSLQNAQLLLAIVAGPRRPSLPVRTSPLLPAPARTQLCKPRRRAQTLSIQSQDAPLCRGSPARSTAWSSKSVQILFARPEPDRSQQDRWLAET